ncbi:hypothetical protein EVAR_17697_1 [Eumeta japonica]|uniref:Uncharacterized protein n=1 Tax=Eumeta variegata TaxID=151549 RepID=A0A4C1US62_EUMVA|nr:hypothetical protein EVAR_17697_1 [Eumeta japonica]
MPRGGPCVAVSRPRDMHNCFWLNGENCTGGPSVTRWSPPSMYPRNPGRVKSASSASWEGIRYLMAGNRVWRGEVEGEMDLAANLITHEDEQDHTFIENKRAVAVSGIAFVQLLRIPVVHSSLHDVVFLPKKLALPKSGTALGLLYDWKRPWVAVIAHCGGSYARVVLEML